MTHPRIILDALDKTNQELAAQGLYVSHFFTEDLLLSKLMRDDPLDRSDAQFLVRHNGWLRDDVQAVFAQARIPDIAELREQFAICSEKLLKEMA